uniref:MAM domain-containing protein n=1 Tax=Panagrolaimus superbus TaxID=310955 RepID=A0A914Z2V8_9BILA
MIRTILPNNNEESPWSSKVHIQTPPSESASLTYQNAIPESSVAIEESCDFEPIHMCDFFSESTAPLHFRRQSSSSDPSLPKSRKENTGHFMVIQSTRDPTEKYGRLYSPIWTFDNSLSFCLSFWDYIRKDSFGSLILSILYEGDSINMAIPIYKKKLEKIAGKDKWHKILIQSKLLKNRSFQIIFEVRKSAPRQRFWVAIDDILAHGGHCPNDGLRYDSIAAGNFF